MTTADIKYRINRRVFNRYLAQETSELGSERKVAQSVGVSHTLIRFIRRGRDDRNAPKTHVNLATARLFEAAWDMPRDVCFVAEAIDDREISKQAA